MSPHEKTSLVQALREQRISRREFAGKALALGFSASAISGLLQSCGDSGGNASNGPVQITVWTWPDNDKTFAKTVPIFQKKNPNIKVKVEAFGDNYHDKLLAAIVAGSGPDVAMVEIGNVAKFKAKPGFVNLAQSPYSADKDKGNYAVFSWDYAADEQTGKVFVLPKNTGPAAMFYRRDLFQKAGLPTEPDKVQGLLKDWDAFLSVGKQLTVSGKQWAISSANEIFGTIRAQAGVSNYDAQGNLQLRNPDFIAALQYAQNAWRSGIVTPITDGSPEWTAAVQNGTIATFLSGNWFGGLLKSVYAKGTDGKWGVAFAPAYKGNSGYNSGGDFIGVLESSQHKDAAWEFCKFVTQDMDSLKTMYAANDLYPAWLPALKESWMNDSDPFYAGQQVNSIFSVVQSKMVPPITNPNDPIVSTVLTTTLIDITKGNMSIDAALTKAEQQVRAKTGK